MKYKKYIWIGIGLIIVLVLAFVLYSIFFSGEKNNSESFKIDTIFLKVAIEKTKETVNNVKITNSLNADKHFSIIPVNLGNLVTIKNQEFDIGPNNAEILPVTFKTNSDKPGVYLGQLKIISGSEEKIIPTILEIQSEDVLFDSNINIFPQGDLILGEKLTANIKVFDLANIGRSKINLAYSVSDFEGKTIVSESEDLVVDGTLDYSKTIDLPQSMKEGNYVLFVVVTYKDSVGTASTLFNVVQKKNEITSNNSLIFWIVIIFGFFFLLFLGLFFYSIIYRDKLLEELQKQYKREIKRQRDLINRREKEAYAKLRNSAEKKVYKKELERVKKQRIDELKNIHKKRLNEYHKIKRKCKGDELKQKLKKWKKQGYDTSVLETRYRLPDVNNIRAKINKWKKQGYDTSLLESE